MDDPLHLVNDHTEPRNEQVLRGEVEPTHTRSMLTAHRRSVPVEGLRAWADPQNGVLGHEVAAQLLFHLLCSRKYEYVS
jgi:hypothetical protein